MVHRLELASELLKGATGVNILYGFDNLRSFVHAYRHNATLIGTEIDDEKVASADDTDSGSVKNA